MVIINATDGIPLTPRGKNLQRPGQAAGGRHLVGPGPHLHRADDDLQLHAPVHLEGGEGCIPCSPRGVQLHCARRRDLFVQGPVSC